MCQVRAGALSRLFVEVERAYLRTFCAEQLHLRRADPAASPGDKCDGTR
jgi:hypothetical protein